MGWLHRLIFVALILVPGVVAWFLNLRGLGEADLPTSVAPVIQFPSQNVVHDFTNSHEEIDAA